ncbi:hypothetical protein WP8S18E06_26070 [Klebsiella sp. WP8-S18-ESBL-06]|nr:hypothetical protein WP8S18E06_26070 [Klebsiella sp. WP8-S18-ESBL-06]
MPKKTCFITWLLRRYPSAYPRLTIMEIKR